MFHLGASYDPKSIQIPQILKANSIVQYKKEDLQKLKLPNIDQILKGLNIPKSKMLKAQKIVKNFITSTAPKAESATICIFLRSVGQDLSITFWIISLGEKSPTFKNGKISSTKGTQVCIPLSGGFTFVTNFM